MGFYVGQFYPDRTGVVVKERKRRKLPRVRSTLFTQINVKRLLTEVKKVGSYLRHYCFRSVLLEANNDL